MPDQVCKRYDGHRCEDQRARSWADRWLGIEIQDARVIFFLCILLLFGRFFYYLALYLSVLSVSRIYIHVKRRGPSLFPQEKRRHLLYRVCAVGARGRTQTTEPWKRTLTSYTRSYPIVHPPFFLVSFISFFSVVSLSFFLPAHSEWKKNEPRERDVPWPRGSRTRSSPDVPDFPPPPSFAPSNRDNSEHQLCNQICQNGNNFIRKLLESRDRQRTPKANRKFSA